MAVDADRVARVEDRGRVELLDDRRAVDARACGQRVAVVDRAVDEGAGLGEVDGRRSFGSGAVPGSRCRNGGLAIRPTVVRRRLTHSTGSSAAANPYVRSCSAWKRSSSGSPDSRVNGDGAGIVS